MLKKLNGRVPENSELDLVMAESERIDGKLEVGGCGSVTWLGSGWEVLARLGLEWWSGACGLLLNLGSGTRDGSGAGVVGRSREFGVGNHRVEKGEWRQRAQLIVRGRVAAQLAL